MIVCTRIIDGKETQYVRYYISSLVSDAERLADRTQTLGNRKRIALGSGCTDERRS